MEFEDILMQVGDYGKYQRDLITFFVYPAAAMQPFFALNLLFLLSVPDHWCNVPELDAWNLSTDEKKNLIMPPSDPMCSMYDMNYTQILSSSSGNWSVPEGTATKLCPNGWNYDKTNHESTAATQWNLVCGDSHYVSMVLTLATVGSIVGTPIYGALSDRIGRRPVFFFTATVAFVAGLSSILTKDFTAFVVLRVITGTIMPSVFQLAYILLLEIVGPEFRARLNGLTMTSWTVGLCLLPLLAWLCRGWIVFGIVSSCSTLTYLLYFRFLPESPRVLLSREKYDEATAVMMQIAKKNGKKVDEDHLKKQLRELGERIKREREQKVQSGEVSLKLLMNFPKLRKYFLILTLGFIADVSSYSGLQINAANLDGNEFLNFFLLSVVEFPGYFLTWWFMQAFGRRWCAVWTRAITGLACMIPLISSDWNVVASLIGKFGAAAAFIVLYQQCSEIYPTPIRALGLGGSQTTAQVVMFALPYIIYLAEYGKYIPFVIIGVICLISACVSSLLPETRNANLPQTVLDVEKFGRDQKFFSWNRRRPSYYDQRFTNQKTKEKDNHGLTEL